MSGQELSFRDSIKTYDRARISTNARGMQALDVWGLTNIAGGAAGYFIATDKEAKYFFEMDAAWGVVNTGIATLGFMRAKRQARQKPDLNNAYNAYRHDRNAYLIGVGLDVVFVAGGAGLTSYGNQTKNNPELYRGYGKAVMLQGVMLLIFDNVMVASHQHYGSKWAKIMDEIRFTGAGFSYNF